MTECVIEQVSVIFAHGSPRVSIVTRYEVGSVEAGICYQHNIILTDNKRLPLVSLGSLTFNTTQFTPAEEKKVERAKAECTLWTGRGQ